MPKIYSTHLFRSGAFCVLTLGNGERMTAKYEHNTQPYIMNGPMPYDNVAHVQCDKTSKCLNLVKLRH